MSLDGMSGGPAMSDAWTQSGAAIDAEDSPGLSNESLPLLRFLLGVSVHSPERAQRFCDELVEEFADSVSPLVAVVRVLRERLAHEFRFGVGDGRVDVKRGIGYVALALRQHQSRAVAYTGGLLLEQLRRSRHK